jgi:hypothetical protein
VSNQGPRAIAAAARLREALEQTADALAEARLDGLLAGEARLEEALARLVPLKGLSAAECAVVRDELERARGALLRCRRLGSALSDFVRLSFEAQGRVPGYGPRDGSATLAYAGRGFTTRA